MRTLAVTGLILMLALVVFDAAPIAPTPRRIPPQGLRLSIAQEQEVRTVLAHLAGSQVTTKKRKADLRVIHKAIRFALENDEFFEPEKDLKKIAALVRAATTPEKARYGLKIRGYRSIIDGSLQPYGIDIPEGLNLDEPVPVWIWLHGRGDKETDLHFLHRRLTRGGPFRPQDAIVLHPFGRQCIGWKHAGELDVFDALDDLETQYRIDRNKVALCGFSMGGAGAWHIGAHYTDRFAAVHAGAGFAETARYNKLKPADYPHGSEQILWGLYDVPNYARNLINVPLMAYSGENDKQIQAARVMAEALTGHGYTLKHVIGIGMGHKYHPDSASLIEDFIRASLTKGRNPGPSEVHLQTRTLRYNRMHWLEILGLEKHWQNSTADAKITGNLVALRTGNLTELQLNAPIALEKVQIDGQHFNIPAAARVHLHKRAGKWTLGKPENLPLRKIPGLQGPIDDAFMAPFLAVFPTKMPQSAPHRRWLEFEIAHFKKRWKELFRGELRWKHEHQLTADDHAKYNIIAWGIPENSGLVKSVIGHAPAHNAALQIVSMIRPNPANQKKYLVINSGPTFRENHDRTNSLQNPKLGDWAIIDLNKDPDGETPGNITASGFFDEAWR
ncbi:MAG: prolyl oligopeptidase family serine peptidase [Verrucomicrobiales bacterium]